MFPKTEATSSTYLPRLVASEVPKRTIVTAKKELKKKIKVTKTIFKVTKGDKKRRSVPLEIAWKKFPFKTVRAERMTYLFEMLK